MKKLLYSLIAIVAIGIASQEVKAQTSGDILVPQRSGTSAVNLYPTGSGASYAIIRTGTCVLTSGSATVADVNVTAGSIFHFCGVGVTNAGSLALGTIVSGTSFTVLSTSGSDSRTVHWWFLKQ